MADQSVPEGSEPSTRERIIQEASRLFAADGIKATTMARIESAVGLREGSGGVNRYFRSKDDLVRAVLEAQLARGTQSQAAAQSWPRPEPGEVEGFLRMAGLFTLAESEHGREVALIGLREGRHLYDRFPDLRGRNFELAFTSVADEIRAFQARAGSDLGVDADALGFLFMGPLLYHRIIEWLTGETALGITDDQLIAQWAQLLAPTIERLVAGREAEPS